MNKAQDTLYWREWGNVTKRCKKEGWALPDRHELHAKALGVATSHKDFSNAQFDKVLAVFRSLSEAENLNAQVRQERMPRTRLEHRIKIEQMRLLAIVLAPSGGGQGEPALPARSVEPDFERAFNYYAEVARIHGGPDLAFVNDEPDPTRTDEKSDLELIRDTLDARLTKLRQERVAAVAGLSLREYQKLPTAEQRRLSADNGWSWHEVKMAAGVECECAGCKKKAKHLAVGHQVPAPEREEVAA